MTIQTFRVQLTNNWWVGERMIFIFGQLGGVSWKKGSSNGIETPRIRVKIKMFESPPVI